MDFDWDTQDARLGHIARRREPLEATIRRVIREELRRTG
jgi:hypothetical protein